MAHTVGGNQKLTNWTYGLLSRRESMPDSGNQANGLSLHKISEKKKCVFYHVCIEWSGESEYFNLLVFVFWNWCNSV